MLAADFQKMGSSSSRPESGPKEAKKSAFHKLLARFQLCPKPEKSPSKKMKKEDVTPKPPIRNHAGTPQPKLYEEECKMNKFEWTEVPLQVPESPARVKNLNHTKEVPVPPPRKHKLKIQKLLTAPYVSQSLQKSNNSTKPVEESIIVPKKVFEHICDGTHHHVHNVINGKVIEEIVDTKHNGHKEIHPQSLKASSLSLPSYVDVKLKEEKRAKSPNKIKKNTSESSLSVEKKIKPNTAAEKIESYISKCKSFGSIRPQQKGEKSKSLEIELDKDSEDSWNGLDDWDLGIIEHDVHTSNFDTKREAVTQKNAKDERNNKILHPRNSSNNFLNGSNEFVREGNSNEVTFRESMVSNTSSDICKDFAEPDMRNITIPTEKSHLNSKVETNFERNLLSTSEFLNHEALFSSKELRAIPKKLAPLATFDSDRDINKLLNMSNAISDTPKHGIEFANNPTKKYENLYFSDKVSNENVTPKVTPRRKSGIGHSNLLKFIKNSTDNNLTEAKKSDKIKDISNTVEDHTSEEFEPKIIPEIRHLEASWQELVQRDNEGKLSSLIELESSLSDSLDTSSNDTKSTTIDTGFKCT